MFNSCALFLRYYIWLYMFYDLLPKHWQSTTCLYIAQENSSTCCTLWFNWRNNSLSFIVKDETVSFSRVFRSLGKPRIEKTCTTIGYLSFTEILTWWVLAHDQGCRKLDKLGGSIVEAPASWLVGTFLKIGYHINLQYIRSIFASKI